MHEFEISSPVPASKLHPDQAALSRLSAAQGIFEGLSLVVADCLDAIA